MPKVVSIADAKRRDAEIQLESPKSGERGGQASARDGTPLHVERLVKSTEKTTYDALLRGAGDDAKLAESLIAADPEIDRDRVGRRLGRASRVHVAPDGQVLYAVRFLQVIVGPDGVEKSRADFIDVEATVGETLPPIPWTGRLLPIDEVVKKFALVRAQQLRHVNGLTFDFLHEMAAHLEREGKMLMVGAGPKGQKPLIFQTNGTPYRGFLHGVTDGPRYRLVLHLSNLELRGLAPADAAVSS